jgi:hypothetical protein
MERPEGTMPIHRLHRPLAGYEQTAKALRLFLQEQIASDKEAAKPVADSCRFAFDVSCSKTAIFHPSVILAVATSRLSRFTCAIGR